MPGRPPAFSGWCASNTGFGIPDTGKEKCRKRACARCIACKQASYRRRTVSEIRKGITAAWGGGGSWRHKDGPSARADETRGGSTGRHEPARPRCRGRRRDGPRVCARRSGGASSWCGLRLVWVSGSSEVAARPRRPSGGGAVDCIGKRLKEAWVVPGICVFCPPMGSRNGAGFRRGRRFLRDHDMQHAVVQLGVSAR